MENDEKNVLNIQKEEMGEWRNLCVSKMLGKLYGYIHGREWENEKVSDKLGVLVY